MSDLFYRKRETNSFDNLVVDVEELYRKFPIGTKIEARPNAVEFAPRPHRYLYRNPLIPLKYRNYCWHLLRRLHLDWAWFEEFRSYWTSILGGRPLIGFEDFYFLRGLYRVKFQDNQLPQTDDPRVHLDAWQRPELIHLLFQFAYMESLSNQSTRLGLLRRYMKGPIGAMLEFGCATCPITTSYFEFFTPHERTMFYIADIQTVAFHYGAYKFRKCSNVIPILLTPNDHFALNVNRKMDVIFCKEVFEHLDRPLDTLKRFHELLNPGGILIFDYIKGDGTGLDTLAGVKERDSVLDAITERFEIIYGQVTKDKSVGLTFARKP